MPNAAILRVLQPVAPRGEYDIIRTDDFTDIIYALDGFLSSFIYKGVHYIYCSDSNFHNDDFKMLKIGFYNEDKYLDYMSGIITANQLVQHNFTYKTQFTKVQDGDTIITVRPELYMDYSWFYRTTFRWAYDPNDDSIIEGYLTNKRIVVPNTASKNQGVLDPYADAAVSFFTNHKTKILASNLGDDTIPSLELLVKITISLNHTINFLFEPFWVDDECSDYLEEQMLDWATKLISPKLSYKALSSYYGNLMEYQDDLFNNQRTFIDAPREYKLYAIATMFSNASLNLFTLDIKKRLLHIALYEKLSVITRNTVDEYLVVKILLSFRDDQTDDINSLLKYLTEYCSKGSTQTKYDRFLNSMSKPWFGSSSLTTVGDWGFQTKWEPEYTQDAFIKALYTLWLRSKYNPYKVGGDDEGEYKDNIGIRVGFGDDVQYEVPYLNIVELQSFPPGYANYYTTYENSFSIDWNTEKIVYQRTDAAPICLNYESHTGLGFYIDNFKFHYHERGIQAFEEYVIDGAEIEDEDLRYYILRGTYELFQPIQLIDVMEETIIPMPLSSGEDIDIAGKNINSLIPVFLLKYIDDKGDASDLLNAIGLVTDIASTVSGVGNLLKLRHLKHLSKLDKCARAIFGTIELTSSVSNVIMEYVLNCNSTFCNKLRTFLFCLEVSTLSFDSAHSLNRARRAAKDVQNHIDTHGAPSDFNHAPTLQLILDLSDIENYLVRLKVRIKDSIKKRIKSENIKYSAVDNLEVGSTVNFPPRFSLKKFTKSTEATTINGQTINRTVYTKTADDLHSASDLDDMIEHGYEILLPASDIEGLMLKSYRTMKQVDKAEVIVWMDNFDNFLTPVNLGGRGKLSYCFNNQAHFELFGSQYNSLRRLYGMESIKTITFGGSCTTKLLPPDLDLVHYISKQQYDDLIKHYQSTLDNYIKKCPKVDNATITRIKAGLENSIKNRKIDLNCMIHFDESTKKLRFFKSDLKNLSSIKTLNVSDPKKLFDFNIFDSNVGSGISPEYTYNL